MAAVESQLAFGRELSDTGRFAFDQRTPLTFGTTPGGTFYATTPRGTRITYDREFLMTCQNSPLAKSVPKNLPRIPGVTVTEQKPAVAANANNAKADTRIKYDREFLLQCEKSPLAKIAPKNLPNIPGLTRADAAKTNGKPVRADSSEEAQFDLEM